VRRRNTLLALAGVCALVVSLTVASQASANNDCQSYGSITLPGPTQIMATFTDAQGCAQLKAAVRNWPTGASAWDTYPTKTTSIPAGSFAVYAQNVSSSQLRAYRGCTVPAGVPVACTLGSWKTNSVGSQNF